MKPLFSKPAVAYHRNPKIPKYFRKMLGTYRGIFPRIPSVKVLVWSFIASFVGVGFVAALSYHADLFVSHQLPTMVGSFGASAVLIYGVIDSPLAQPRSFVGGHVISAFVGVSIGKICTAIFARPDNFMWLQAALSVSIAIVAMQITRTVHPPGGATALIAVTSGPKISDLGYLYMAMPILFGAVLMLFVALIFNNLARQYPLYWRYPRKPDVIVEYVNESDSSVDTQIDLSDDRGEMYGPKIINSSNANLKETAASDNSICHDTNGLHTEPDSVHQQDGSTVVAMVDDGTEAAHCTQYRLLAESYQKKYEDTLTRLQAVEQELKLLRSTTTLHQS
ncbi:HPP-domain-containing protein [Basidiobolus meristosporus CBS 931.73]|uniref:HPP-domain-containing protein n=1 Tax=Basidiobolus meristosporus CBS 931.73 TaxID=1314790 RepID=A0A1Y1X992_9FUNG|nr:HPP-domain-containing protein [Basidiobolus meristosporus CBS 931.73]|eukprot:ORX82307.1 HPP-domain-containing protein [Basidiobolus meristosporus CBS 931.73]